MAKKRTRSRGVRNPARNAMISGVIALSGIVLVVLGILDMRESGTTESRLFGLGLLPAISSPMFFVHYFSKISVFRDLRSGRISIARWTITADEFNRFIAEEARLPAGSIMINFYKPPASAPADGVEIIFSDAGVLIGDGYFPLSTIGGRRVQSVRLVDSVPFAIEFTLNMNSMARTSSATINTVRSSAKLRVPVASDAARQAHEVVFRYQALIDRQ